MVDSGASGHYFDEAIIPGFRDRLEEYNVCEDAPSLECNLFSVKQRVLARQQNHL